jgi:hypothetical protein
MTDNTYQGWKNYETWNIALWLDNEQAAQSLMRDNAIESIHQVLYDEKTREVNDEIRKDLIEKASFKLSSLIKEWIEENNPLAESASMYCDLLNAAISQADLKEIAQHYLDDDLVDAAIEDWDFEDYCS